MEASEGRVFTLKHGARCAGGGAGGSVKVSGKGLMAGGRTGEEIDVSSVMDAGAKAAGGRGVPDQTLEITSGHHVSLAGWLSTSGVWGHHGVPGVAWLAPPSMQLCPGSQRGSR